MECDCGATPAFRAVGNTIELEEAAKPRHSEARTSHSPRVTAARQAHVNIPTVLCARSYPPNFNWPYLLI
eukprot:4760323-Pyramimonas_sp.AAC.1